MAPLYQLAGGLAMLSGFAAAKYDEYILAPTSRTLYPAKVHGSNGTITGAESLIGGSGGEAVFDGVAAVTYDFVSIEEFLTGIEQRALTPRRARTLQAM